VSILAVGEYRPEAAREDEEELPVLWPVDDHEDDQSERETDDEMDDDVHRSVRGEPAV
jgi:hypothetical protein